MLSSKIVDATDPDRFAAAIRPQGDFMVTGRGSFKARSTLFDLGRVYAQRVEEQLARIKHSELLRGGVLFLTEPGPSMFMNGAQIGINQIAVVNPGASYTSRLSGATHWGAVTLAKEVIDDLDISETGGCLARSAEVTVLTPPPSALDRLRSLNVYMGWLAKTDHESAADTQLTHDLEYSLVDTVHGILNMQASRSGPISRTHHRLIVDRFRTLLEAHADGPVDLANISRRIGISPRTLRLACQEHLAVSPLQYVFLRRMRSARRALLQADPDISRVTDIATDHGFWELGRFAVNYRKMFGESPSLTLRRAA
jgi:AraC-like DNA-binding protein